jgi:hypothetical protein
MNLLESLLPHLKDNPPLLVIFNLLLFFAGFNTVL